MSGSYPFGELQPESDYDPTQDRGESDPARGDHRARTGAVP